MCPIQLLVITRDRREFVLFHGEQRNGCVCSLATGEIELVDTLLQLEPVVDVRRV